MPRGRELCLWLESTGVSITFMGAGKKIELLFVCTSWWIQRSHENRVFFLSLVNHMSKEDEGHHAGLLRALESPASLASGHADILWT